MPSRDHTRIVPVGAPLCRARPVWLLSCAALALAAVGGGCRARGCSSGDEVPEIVPPELADVEALGELSDWWGLPVVASGRYRVQSSEDRLSGEGVAIPLWDHGNRDMNNFVCASADADPPAGTEPFLHDVSSCTERWVRGHVLARFEGSGRLARMWMTAASIRRGPADHEVLRLYVDDEHEPVVQVKLSRALDGTAGEMFARPFGAGSSRRMAWHYPVVFGSRLVVTLDRLDPKDLYFYQVAAVLDEATEGAGKPRHRAAERLAQRDRAIALLEADAPALGETESRSKRFALGPGGSDRLQLIGPATVVRASIRVPEADVELLGAVDLTVRWDGRDAPAMATSLQALYAAGLAPVELPSLALGASWQDTDLVLSLRLPMPFALSADWELRSRASRPVVVSLELETKDELPPAPWRHLVAQTEDTGRAGPRMHPIASAIGPGRLVGACLAMQGHALRRADMPGHPMNFLEGDERGIVDGDIALAGTGTEDYFDGAFYFEDAPSASPFAQAWDVSDGAPTGKGRASACRWHVLGDEIDFREALELELEIGPGVPDVLDRFRSVAFLYAEP